MSRNVLRWGVLCMAVVTVAALVAMPLQAEDSRQDKAKAAHKGMGAKSMCGGSAARGECSGRLEKIEKLIDDATAALGKGHKDHALGKLKAAKALIAECRKVMASGATKKIVNAVCPLMGSKLDLSKVTHDLTRQYKGKQVGFCCEGCPGAWDKLSDDEKAKKLHASMPKAKKVEAAKMHEKVHGGHH